VIHGQSGSARHESDGFDIPCVPWQLLALQLL
jgi:hypothetical protein